MESKAMWLYGGNVSNAWPAEFSFFQTIDAPPTRASLPFFFFSAGRQLFGIERFDTQ